MSEVYTGFYTSRPFWAGEALDLHDSETKACFTEMMAEHTFVHDFDSFSLRVCRDGMFMLQVAELEQEFLDAQGMDGLVRWWSRYVDFANAVQLLFESAALHVMEEGFLEFSEITRNDAFRLGLEGERVKRQVVPAGSISAFYQMGRYLQSYGMVEAFVDPLIDFDTRISSRREVPLPVFKKLAESLEVAATDEALLSSLASIARALSQYKVGNYSTSLVLSWFVIESVVNRWWDKFLADRASFDDDTTRINKHRRGTLGGMNYPVSVVLNILELSDDVPFPWFSRIDEVRKWRNKVAHGDPKFECEGPHCRKALGIAKELVLDGHSLDVSLDLTIRAHF